MATVGSEPRGKRAGRLRPAGWLALLLGLLLTGCGLPGADAVPPASSPPVTVTPTPAAPEVTPTPTTTPTPAPRPLRGMSFNVRQAYIQARSAGHPDAREFQWPTSRGPAAVKYITEADPDIVGFQEVEHRMKGIDGRRIRGEMVTVLAEGLPDYTFTKATQKNNFLPIAFKTRKYKLLEHGRMQIQYTSDPHSDSNRFATWAMLKVKHTGQRLLVVNLWANDGSSRSMALGRAQAWERLLPALADLTDGHRIPSVLVGDFNSRQDKDEYPFNAHLTAFAEAGWLDASKAPENLQKVPEVSSYNGWGRRIDGVFHANALRPGPRIDYIWTNGGAVPLTWQIYLPEIEYREVGGEPIPFAKGTIPSDHWPVVADVALPAADR